jgi:hypothetical protein
MANTLHHRVSASCCKGSPLKNHCGQQKNIPYNDCAKGTCNTMLSCSICGFLIISSIAVSPAIMDLNNQIAHPFITDELSDYQDNDWNPPKA